MIHIQRKSAVKPITGSIVDTSNVEDKITNAPSINLMEQMVGAPTDSIIMFDGDEIPYGYEEVEIQESVQTKVLYNAFETLDFTPCTSWQTYQLSDSLDNYDALLTQFFYTNATTTSGYLLLTSSFDYYQKTTCSITGTVANWDSSSELNTQTLQYQIYHSQDTEQHNTIRIQHCNSMSITPSGNTLKAGRMGIARIIGYKFNNNEDKNNNELSINLINFTVNCAATDIGNKTYQAEQGMTFAQWIDSEYNVDNYYLEEDNNEYIRLNGTYYLTDAIATDVIENNKVYSTSKGK